MSRRARTFYEARLAQEARIRLLKILAPTGRCAGCGHRHRATARDPDRTWAKLEVDHRDGRDWNPSALSQLGRVRRYWQEFGEGVRLRALCRSCNGKLWGGRGEQLVLPGHRHRRNR